MLAPRLPYPIPVPLARGEPGCGFTRPWSIYGWIDGQPAALAPVRDLERLAEDLAGFLIALQQVPAEDGPRAGPHSFGRGGPVSVWDGETRAALDHLGDRIDGQGAHEVWEAALASSWGGPDVWVHGDMAPSNFLVRNDRLCGVIDFGCSAVGDPACDLTPAWTVFEGESRRRFMRAVPVDDDTWARARGWALWKAVISVPTLPEDDAGNDGSRYGWRWTALGVVDQIITEFRSRPVNVVPAPRVTDPGVRRSAPVAGRRGPCGGRTPRSSRRAPRAATSTRRHCRARSAGRRR